jgi:hypothetical protein
MKKKSMIISTIVLLVLTALLVAGCQKAPNTPPDTFNAAYQFAEASRSISISGNSYGNPGAQSEYQLKINNGPDRWQDEYYVLLLDSDSVVKEISHEVFDLPGGGGIQQPVMVKFPEGFTGALGLCVLIPQRGNLIATLSVGSKDAVAAGWPDITNYSDWKISD